MELVDRAASRIRREDEARAEELLRLRPTMQVLLNGLRRARESGLDGIEPARPVVPAEADDLFAPDEP